MSRSDFKYFRSATTGLVGKYPAHFEFLPDLIPVESDEADCTDCGLSGPVYDEDEDQYEFEVETDPDESEDDE